ncbi:hypothetical protein MMC22_011006 [Lobaria immixta]|nr:hypothetical protein [Lobaria immixta]
MFEIKNCFRKNSLYPAVGPQTAAGNSLGYNRAANARLVDGQGAPWSLPAEMNASANNLEKRLQPAPGASRGTAPSQPTDWPATSPYSRPPTSSTSTNQLRTRLRADETRLSAEDITKLQRELPGRRKGRSKRAVGAESAPIHIFIVVEEANRVPEPDMWNVLGNDNPAALVMIGDEKQLPTTRDEQAGAKWLCQPPALLAVLSSDRTGPHLRRMVEMIGDMASTLFDYEKMFTNGRDTLLDRRPRATEVKKYFRRHYNVNSPLLQLKVAGESLKDQTPSQFNRINVSVVLSPAMDMIAEGVLRPEDITILTFYRTQWKLYRQQLQPRIESTWLVHVPKDALVMVADVVGLTAHKREWENRHFAAVFDYMRRRKGEFKVKDAGEHQKYPPKMLATASSRVHFKAEEDEIKRISGHVVNLMQNTAKIINPLPSLPTELQVVILKPSSSTVNDSVVDREFAKTFRVQRESVETWLDFLVIYHPDYQDVIIEQERLSQLPGDDTVIDAFSTVLHDEADVNEEDIDEENVVRAINALLESRLTRRDTLLGGSIKQKRRLGHALVSPTPSSAVALILIHNVLLPSPRVSRFSLDPNDSDSSLTSLEDNDIQGNINDKSKEAATKKAKRSTEGCHCSDIVPSIWQRKVMSTKTTSAVTAVQLLIQSRQFDGICYRHLHALGGKLSLQTNKLDAPMLQTRLNKVYDRCGDLWDLKTNSTTYTWFRKANRPP